MIIKSLLDSDFYKISMCQFAFHQYRTFKVAYRFVCRNKEVDLSSYADEIRNEINSLSLLHFTEDEIAFLRSTDLMKEDFLDYLRSFQLNSDQIKVFVKDGQLKIEAEGIWCETILFEVLVLSIVNEVYFRNTQPNADKSVALAKLYEKIDLVKELNHYSELHNYPLFKFIDFGTRRRFSSIWQGEIDEILIKELPNNFIGTSSVYWAMKCGIRPVGTMAHEFLQFFQAVSPELKHFQRDALFAWLKEYDGKISIALTDVITTDAFFNDFGNVLTRAYSGLRHDSSDPFKWADKVLEHYRKHAIDPKEHTLVFSDGLNFQKARDLYLYTIKFTNPIFGIGTNLTNDYGFTPLNIVMKMIMADGKPVAKISDEPSKSICDDNNFLNNLKVMFKVED